ncbi:MAG TPA: transaldolase family protein [Pelolinea sp.]|nr:transaldolase family protein [Pelolinea sp.]
MQLLLDSAIIDDARQAAGWGWVSGATTNPTLLAKSGLPPAKTLKKLGKLFKGPIFYQLTGESLEAMKEEAKLAEELLGKQLVLKIPSTALGFEAAARLSKKYAVAITSVFTAAQALVAHAAGAQYALYYHNRAKHLLPDGAELAKKLIDVLAHTDMRVVAASLKSPEELMEARLAGVSILSAPFEVLARLPMNEHSDAAVLKFKKSGTGLLNHRKKEST